MVPAIMVHTVGDRDADWTDECEISVEVLEGFPAYDPVANEVVTVEFYDRKMSSFDDEIAVQWFDAGTGEVLRSELIMGDHGHMSCSGAGQRARRRSKAVNEQLASGRWESMETVPLRLVHGMSYQNLRYFSAEPNLTPEDLEVLAGLEESLMPRGEVHAVVRGGEMIVRLPGVRVYERDPALVELETVSRIVAHPSGVVVMTATTCRDEEDCTCNTEETSMVLRWSPTTLAAVQRWPCIADASEDGAEDGATCELQSIYL